MFRDLARGRFVALGPAVSRRPLPIEIGTVETAARSTSPKLMPLPDTAPEAAADLIFTPGPEELRAPPRRHTPPAPTPTADILSQLTASRPQPQPEKPEEALPEVDAAERERLLSAVMREILEDPDAAYRSDAVLYQDFLVRCRIRRVPGEPLPLRAFRRGLAVARAGLDGEPEDGSAWQTALELSKSLPDDLQGVFLLVARAAIERAPCPPDAVLARAYGTHSARRARKLLSFFEERRLLVMRTDFHGKRIAAFPDLACETAAGDPDAIDPGVDLPHAAE
jgi:uncharacterized protein